MSTASQTDRPAHETAGMSHALRMHGVVKRYGSIVAVDGLDLEVPAGICFGLLGPNGAGKSTTMRMLTAQTLADAGTLEVLGYRLPGESKQSRLEMGVVPQLDNLDVELTCRQVLTVFARLYRVPRGERALRCSGRWRPPTWCRAQTRSSRSSPAACAAGCSSHAG